MFMIDLQSIMNTDPTLVARWTVADRPRRSGELWVKRFVCLKGRSGKSRPISSVSAPRSQKAGRWDPKPEISPYSTKLDAYLPVHQVNSAKPYCSTLINGRQLLNERSFALATHLPSRDSEGRKSIF